MGFGYNFRCKKCGYKYNVRYGEGMLFPEIYQKTVADISNGVYGDLWKDLYNSTKYAAVNADKVVYICNACKKWEIGTDITLYAPNDPDYIRTKVYGKKTVAEWGFVPYVMNWELTANYHIIKKYFHRCKKCGRRMHKAAQKELENLPCPKCNEINSFIDNFMWD